MKEKLEPKMNQPAEKLSFKNVKDLIAEYGPRGLREGEGRDIEYLILSTTKEDGTTEEIFMHKFKNLGPFPIEDRIRAHLGLSPKPKK